MLVLVLVLGSRAGGRVGGGDGDNTSLLCCSPARAGAQAVAAASSSGDTHPGRLPRLLPAPAERREVNSRSPRQRTSGAQVPVAQKLVSSRAAEMGLCSRF